MKPRLKMQDGLWMCFTPGDKRIGSYWFGRTPFEAYEAWSVLRITKNHRIAP